MKNEIQTKRIASVLLLLLLSSVPLFAQVGQFSESVYRTLKWRHIGPANIGGRVDDIAVVESNPNIIYIGSASGGVWRTTDNGITWKPVFDDQPVSSIGDVTVAPSDPSIVWVGTGEQNNRQSSSWGNGVYKSMDGGNTWKHMGLEDSHHIGRIVIDRHDPNIVYVAAAGHLWGANKERGLYKTTDGGQTWKDVLLIDEDTGVIDVAMDPQSPSTLYAAAYQRRRTTWGFDGGGPHSGLYKTSDGGVTWKKLSNGLPSGDTGRIGIDIYLRNPNVVYVSVENKTGGVFRSNDRGETWTKMSSVNPRGSYYSNIRIDPNNDQRIWLLNASMYVSEDGGKTFRTDVVNITPGQPPNGIHGDFHALWIDPANSDHMLTGNDGGINVSYDRGRSWNFWDTIPLGQFYEVSADMRKPYNVYGGMQDNGNWMGPSRTVYESGITNEDWMRIGPSADGFYTVADLKDPNTIYVETQNGAMLRVDLRTNEKKPIKPEPKPGEAAYRWDWNTPFIISPHNNQTLYFGANRLFKSTDRGDSWTASEDLTKQIDRNKIPIMGALPSRDMLSLNDGTSSYGQIITIAESPAREGVIYVGTDDGNLQISRDGGKTFQNVIDRVTGVPRNTYVSRVIASAFAPGRAYVAFDGHRGDDFTPYVFVTEDFGQTWRSVAKGLPAGHSVHVIREHPKNQNLLFVGTEFGAFVSFDRGAQWLPFKNNLPMVPVDDIFIHPRDNDLIFATHGRSISIMDDITPLSQLTESVLSSGLTLFDMRPGIPYRIHYNKARPGNAFYVAPNPDYGAYINYYLKGKATEPVKITVTDAAGQVVRQLTGPAEEGINRAVWDLRWTPPVAAKQADDTGEEGGFNSRGTQGPLAIPGEYTVTVQTGQLQATKKVTVEEDPRIQISDADRRAQFDSLLTLSKLYSAADGSQRSLTEVRTQVTELSRNLQQNQTVPANVKSALDGASRQLSDLIARLAGSGGFGGGSSQAVIPRLNRLIAAIDGYTARPTPGEQQQIQALTDELKSVQAQMSKFLETEVPNLNKQMMDNKVPFIRPNPKPR